MCKSGQSRKILHLVAKIGFDTAENGPSKAPEAAGRTAVSPASTAPSWASMSSLRFLFQYSTAGPTKENHCQRNVLFFVTDCQKMSGTFPAKCQHVSQMCLQYCNLSITLMKNPEKYGVFRQSSVKARRTYAKATSSLTLLQYNCARFLQPIYLSR